MIKNYVKCSPAQILGFLQAQKEPLSANEIAAAMGIKKRRIFDSLTTLAAAGSVVRSGKRNDYKYAAPKQDATE
jgi:DNA-binding IclR family transcriptional regulator